LAGWVAGRWPASRLVLLKSAELPTVAGATSFREAAKLGLVDAYFPSLESALPPTWWCSLRGDVSTIEFHLFGR
jgi:hypothetical protein